MTAQEVRIASEGGRTSTASLGGAVKVGTAGGAERISSQKGRSTTCMQSGAILVPSMETAFWGTRAHMRGSLAALILCKMRGETWVSSVDGHR